MGPTMDRKEYTRPQVVEIGSVAGLTLAGSGATAGGGGNKPGIRFDGSGCSLVPQGDGNKGNGNCT